jgi:hypothetical protein
MRIDIDLRDLTIEVYKEFQVGRAGMRLLGIEVGNGRSLGAISLAVGGMQCIFRHRRERPSPIVS